jgi:hypothetical protein
MVAPEWWRPWPQPIDPMQDFGEQRPRHRDLGQLEDEVVASAIPGPLRHLYLADIASRIGPPCHHNANSSGRSGVHNVDAARRLTFGGQGRRSVRLAVVLRLHT